MKIDLKFLPKLSKFERLTWIEIRNFRAFKSVKIDDLADINVFIGKNNTGKSTLLEAIYLNLTKNTRDLLGRIPFAFVFNRRGIYTALNQSHQCPRTGIHMNPGTARLHKKPA
jgi:predicted ATP-binding protein involved in virulence